MPLWEGVLIGRGITETSGAMGKFYIFFLLFLCYLPGPNSILLCPDWSPTSNTSPISDWFYVQNTSPIFAFSLFLLLPPWPKWHHLLLGLGWWPPDGHHWSTVAPSSLVSSPQGSPFTHVIISHSLCSGHTGLLVTLGLLLEHTRCTCPLCICCSICLQCSAPPCPQSPSLTAFGL